MAEKILIMMHEEYPDGFKHITRIMGNKHEETLYAEYVSNDEGKTSYDTIELAVNKEELIKIRDFINTILEE